jgi:hypothetical protein
VQEYGLCLVGFGNATQTDGFRRSIASFGWQHNVTAFDFLQVVQQSASGIAQA